MLLSSHDLRTATPKVADFGIAKMVDTMATAVGTATGGGGEAGARKKTGQNTKAALHSDRNCPGSTAGLINRLKQESVWLLWFCCVRDAGVESTGDLPR